MAEPRISSIGELKQYILRKLGYPAHQVEITDDQLNDAIDDTLDDFTEFAYAGVSERHIPVTLLTGVHQYILPYDVFAVLAVHDGTQMGIGNNVPSHLFSMNNFIAADLYRPGVAKIDLLGYETINQLTSTMNIIFNKKISFDFNSISKVLHIHADVPTDIPVVLQVYKKLDMEGTLASDGVTPRYQEENVYNDRWIKRMSTARAKFQWAMNLSKYSGSVLPNGGALNVDGIREMAQTEIETLTQELHDRYETPIDFFCGFFVLCTLIGYIINIYQNLTPMAI